MDGWMAIPMTAAVAWIGYLIGRKSLPGELELQEMRTVAGACRRCGGADTEYLDLVDWSGTIRGRTLAWSRIGVCNACRHEWVIGTEHRDAA